MYWICSARRAYGSERRVEIRESRIENCCARRHAEVADMQVHVVEGRTVSSKHNCDCRVDSFYYRHGVV